MSFRQAFPHRLSWLILGLYVFLAVLYSVVTPAWEAPDEIGHYAFIQHVRQIGTLPIQQSGVLGEAHQPPLYYLVTAVATLPADISGAIGAFRPNPNFIWAGQGGYDINAGLHGSAETFPFRQQALALHLARGMSILMGLITVALTMKIGWQIFPDQSAIGLLAGGLAAFNPQFLFISGAINNDNLLTMATIGTIWQAMAAARQPERWRSWIYVGLWLAVAVLTKISGLIVVAMVGFFLVVLAFRKRSWPFLFRGALAVGLPIVVVSGWWFVRNQALYGDPLGLAVYEKIFSINLRHSPLQWADISRFFSVQYRSFWGVFGWMNLPAPDWYFTAVPVLLLAALVGIGAFVATSQLRRLQKWQKGALAFLLLAIVMQELYMVTVITRCNESCYQGRYLFPVIGPLMIFVALGLVNLIPWRWERPFTPALLFALAVTALFVSLRVIRPAYETHTLSRWQLWLLPHQTNAAFGEAFALKGYKISHSDAQVNVTFYWQAVNEPDFDYSAFVHLIDEAGNMVAQKDQAPGTAVNYLPTAWSAGDIIADVRTLELPAGMAPGPYYFRVGLYNWTNGQRLPAFLDGAPNGDFIVLPEEVMVVSSR